MRWSKEYAHGEYRLQPFGGSVSKEAEFTGYTIPSEVAVGTHFGTEAYFPFFQVRVTSARYH